MSNVTVTYSITGERWSNRPVTVSAHAAPKVEGEDYSQQIDLTHYTYMKGSALSPAEQRHYATGIIAITESVDREQITIKEIRQIL